MKKTTFKPTGENLSQKQRSLLELVCRELDDELVDHITTNGQIGSAFHDMFEFKIIKKKTMEEVSEHYVTGYLQIDDHQLEVWIDPHMRWDDNRILMGKKEITIELEPMELI